MLRDHTSTILEWPRKLFARRRYLSDISDPRVYSYRLSPTLWVVHGNIATIGSLRPWLKWLSQSEIRYERLRELAIHDQFHEGSRVGTMTSSLSIQLHLMPFRYIFLRAVSEG